MVDTWRKGRQRDTNDDEAKQTKMATKIFTFLLGGIIWFSTASVVYFFYHESTLQPTNRRAILMRIDGDGRQENDGERLRTKLGSSNEFDSELGQLGRDVPRFGPGENGQPVLLYGEAKERADETMRIHNFNLVVSDMISVERTLKDTRHEQWVFFVLQTYRA